MFRRPGPMGLFQSGKSSSHDEQGGWAQVERPAPGLMGLFDWLKSLLGHSAPDAAIAAPPRFGMDELARRLDTPLGELQRLAPRYESFAIRKRDGGSRPIDAPVDELKKIQHRVLHRLLRGLRVHPAAMGFERGRSIVHNARPHVGKVMVLKMDLRDYFNATAANRVHRYLRLIGWDDSSAALLTKICTHRGGLPQGAPTSPRLSNLVNVAMDARLTGLARRFRATYTRYADDLTFSFPEDRPADTHALIRTCKVIVRHYGYELHQRRKLQIRRRHEQQRVTGLIVNEKLQLPRKTRRWLRAVEHHLAAGKPATLNKDQLAGWRALQKMIETG